MNENDIDMLLSASNDTERQTMYERLKPGFKIIESSYRNNHIPTAFDEYFQNIRFNSRVYQRVYGCTVKVEEDDMECVKQENIPKVFEKIEDMVSLMVQNGEGHHFSMLDTIVEEAIEKYESEGNCDKRESIIMFYSVVWDYKVKWDAYNLCCDILVKLKKSILSDPDIRCIADLQNRFRTIGDLAYTHAELKLGDK